MMLKSARAPLTRSLLGFLFQELMQRGNKITHRLITHYTIDLNVAGGARRIGFYGGVLHHACMCNAAMEIKSPAAATQQIHFLLF
jgi:hypothetical protein